MSPNEFQLRAALRDGEGDHIDPETVIARARSVTQARHDRRVRYGSVAAVVAVVGGIGVVAGVALGGGGNDNHSASNADSAKSVTSGAGQDQGGGRAAMPPIAPGALADAAKVPCPASAPKFEVPASGANSQFGAGGSLFSGPVEAVKICAYQQQRGEAVPGPDGQPLNTVLTSQLATDLAASLDAAPKEHPSTACPLYRSANGKTVVIIGVSPSGQAMKPITATVAQNPCNLPITNGTAIRYNWAPPSSLSTFIAKLQPANGGPVGGIPTGKVIGSPIQS